MPRLKKSTKVSESTQTNMVETMVAPPVTRRDDRLDSDSGKSKAAEKGIAESDVEAEIAAYRREKKE